MLLLKSIRKLLIENYWYFSNVNPFSICIYVHSLARKRIVYKLDSVHIKNIFKTVYCLHMGCLCHFNTVESDS